MEGQIAACGIPIGFDLGSESAKNQRRCRAASQFPVQAGLGPCFGFACTTSGGNKAVEGEATSPRKRSRTRQRGQKKYSECRFFHCGFT